MTAETGTSSNLSKAQLLIWAGQKLHSDWPLYNMALAISIEGTVDFDLFAEAFRSVVARSDTLRTIIVDDGGLPRRRILATVPAPIEFQDFSAQSDGRRAAHAWLDRRCKRIFNLSECLSDCTLLKLNDKQFVWFLNQHHLITDGWSASVLIREVGEAYLKLTTGEPITTTPLPGFQAYAEFERSSQGLPAFQKAVGHWKKRRAEAAEPVEFYGSLPESAHPDSERLRFDLGSDRSERLRELAQVPELRSLTLGQTLFSFFGTVLFALLFRLTDRKQITIGAPAHNRPTPEFKNTIGLLIELFPLQLELEWEETFLSLLHKVKEEAHSFLLHARPGSSQPMHQKAFNVVLNFINVSFPDFAGYPTRIDWLHPNCSDPGHHLRLEIHDFGATGEFTLLFDLNSAAFPGDAKKSLVKHFVETLDLFLSRRDLPVQTIELSGTATSSETCPPNEREFAMADTAVEIFESVVRSAPDQPAVACDGQSLTYRELDEQANRLAGVLESEYGVGPGSFVAVAAERSSAMIVAVMAVMKAGAAYVPVDPSYPDERVKLMLEDAGVAVALTHPAELTKRIANLDVEVLEAYDVAASKAGRGKRDCGGTVRADSPAYVIYTSGSTGQPNGVVVEHGNLVSLVAGLRQRVYQPHDDHLNVALLAPLVFDASVQQIFSALLLGHCLHVVPEFARIDGSQLLRFFHEHEIDVTDGTPAHLRLMLETTIDASWNLPSRFIIGGEKLAGPLVAAFYRRFAGQHPVITNIYGVAECTVDSCSFDVTAESAATLPETVPVGLPLANSEILVLNRGLRKQPVGVAGEIAIAGKGVSRGYLNREQLTAQRFVKHPTRPGERIYLTGDLGRYGADGNLHFIGRRDRQVKIRGHRIELGEVEHKIRSYRKTTNARLPVVTPRLETQQRCARCVLTTAHPGVELDSVGICSVCREFESFRGISGEYFQTEEDFRALIREANSGKSDGNYDCLLLYSGGKDSSYVLYRLVDLGLKVLAFTFDNGFISPAAFENIKRQTARLGVESVTQQTAAMNEIFVQSLREDHTVCSGCFRALTTISTRLAHQHEIKVVVTGLSRGQVFDTKLAGLLGQGVRQVGEIEEHLRAFRALFHARTDRTARLLDDDLHDVPLDEMHFVDFFRYDKTPVSEIRQFLEARDERWRQPRDTGFCSSNCRMNDVGVCVHTSERGYHNYEAPLSWDIRLGISRREEVLPEVQQTIDVERAGKILTQIGFFETRVKDVRLLVDGDGDGSGRLTAYYTATQNVSGQELREYLSRSLPGYMIPANFIQVTELPLTTNGKIDDRALNRLRRDDSEQVSNHSAPSGEFEELVADIWRNVLRVDRVGRDDDFFDLGGDSLLAMQIVARINRALRIDLSIADTFNASSVAAVARIVEDRLYDDIAGLSEEEARRLAALDGAERNREGL